MAEHSVKDVQGERTLGTRATCIHLSIIPLSRTCGLTRTSQGIDVVVALSTDVAESAVIFRVGIGGDTVKGFKVVLQVSSVDILQQHTVDVFGVVLCHLHFDDSTSIAKSIVLVSEEHSSFSQVKGVSHSLWLGADFLKGRLGGFRQGSVLRNTATLLKGRLSGGDTPSTLLPRLLGENAER